MLNLPYCILPKLKINLTIVLSSLSPPSPIPMKHIPTVARGMDGVCLPLDYRPPLCGAGAGAIGFLTLLNKLAAL